MANQPETSTFDAGVYQLETVDPVQGGVGGKSNAPLLNLANRTRWLKDHVDALEGNAAGYALLASPTFTGDPKAPTPSAGDNDTSIATTAFVQQAISGISSINVAGGSNVTLTQAQWGCGILILTGALTASINLIFPTNATGRNKWLVVNNTTGPYRITCKTAAGTGVFPPQGVATQVYGDGTNIAMLGQRARVVLSANTTFYVSTTGSDANTGLSSAAPFATIQAAWDHIYKNYDLNGYTATIQLAAGTYTTGVNVYGTLTGAYALTIQGDTVTPSNVHINVTNAYGFAVGGGGAITIKGVKVSASGTSSGQGWAIGVGQGGYANFSDVEFGTCGNGHLLVTDGGFVGITGNYRITGGAQFHMSVNAAEVSMGAHTCTITGTPNFSSAFAFCTYGGLLFSSGMVYSGAATGQRYSATLNSVIQVGGSATYFPGTSAGVITTGGQYN